MSDLRTAAEAALAALDGWLDAPEDAQTYDRCMQAAIDAASGLRAALAQQPGSDVTVDRTTLLHAAETLDALLGAGMVVIDAVPDVTDARDALQATLAQPAGEPCAGLSCDGFNVHGDDASINEVKRLRHEAEMVPDLRARLVSMRDALAQPAGEPTKRVQCPQCRGSGVGEYVDHGHGPDSIEPIRCDVCDGFGWVDAPLAQPAGEPFAWLYRGGGYTPPEPWEQWLVWPDNKRPVLAFKHSEIVAVYRHPPDPPAIPPRDPSAAAQSAFADYVRTNYPPGTIISDPGWHAPKLLRAAMRALIAHGIGEAKGGE